MPKKVIIAKITGLLFLLASTWIIFFISKVILEAPNNLNSNHIPKNATFVAKVDGKAFLRSGINDIFIDSRDNEIIQLFQNFSGKRGKKKSKKKGKKSNNLGIDFVSDIYFFTFSYENNRILGISLNLSNEKRFKKYLPFHLNELQGFASNSDVGLILHTIIEDKASYPDQKTLNAMAKKLLEKQGNFDISVFDNDNSRTIVKSWSKDGKGSINDFISSSNLSFELAPHKLIFNGTVETPNTKLLLQKDLVPSGFHLFSGDLPQKVSDTLSSLYRDSIFNLPNIGAISMNYRGLSIVENDGFLPVPKIDLLLRFTDKIDIADVLSLKVLNENIQDINGHSFNYQESIFNYEQVDEYTIYIGESNLNTVAAKKDLIFNTSGSMHEITTIEASGMVKAFINLFPLYSASDDFTHSVKNIDVSISNTENGKPQKMNGSVTFKEEKFALNSLIKLMLKGNLIK